MIWIEANTTPPVIPDGEKSVKLFCWCDFNNDYFEGHWDGMLCPNGKLTVVLPSTNKMPPYLPTIAIASHWFIPTNPNINE